MGRDGKLADHRDHLEQRRLIEAEETRKPLSDSRIARILADEGFQVARRTVAKYREGMQIPPSNERRRLT